MTRDADLGKSSDSTGPIFTPSIGGDTPPFPTSCRPPDNLTTSLPLTQLFGTVIHLHPQLRRSRSSKVCIAGHISCSGIVSFMSEWAGSCKWVISSREIGGRLKYRLVFKNFESLSEKFSIHCLTICSVVSTPSHTA